MPAIVVPRKWAASLLERLFVSGSRALEQGGERSAALQVLSSLFPMSRELHTAPHTKMCALHPISLYVQSFRVERMNRLSAVCSARVRAGCMPAVWGLNGTEALGAERAPFALGPSDGMAE